MNIQVTLTEAEKALPRAELQKALDQETDAYARWLETRDGQGALSSFERELIRSYLWFKATASP